MSEGRPLNPAQCRAARALVGWSRADLAGHSGVAATTLAHFEVGKRVPYIRTLIDVRRALEAAGVIFIFADEIGGAGVRCIKEAGVA